MVSLRALWHKPMQLYSEVVQCGLQPGNCLQDCSLRVPYQNFLKKKIVNGRQVLLKHSLTMQLHFPMCNFRGILDMLGLFFIHKGGTLRPGQCLMCTEYKVDFREQPSQTYAHQSGWANPMTSKYWKTTLARLCGQLLPTLGEAASAEHFPQYTNCEDSILSDKLDRQMRIVYVA